MSIKEEVTVKIVDPNDPNEKFETIVTDKLICYADRIELFVDPNFGNTSLDNNEAHSNNRFHQIQIYEICGDDDIFETLKELAEPKPTSFSGTKVLPTVLGRFNYTIETIKRKYEIITGNRATIEKCDRKYCPTYHPYLCAKESNFRNKYKTRDYVFVKKIINDGPSLGNNAPCVSEERFCNMDYNAARTQIDQENSLKRDSALGKYSSKPIHCKVDENTGNKQMRDTTEGGKYNKNKYRSSKMKIRKRSKNSKGLKIRKRSKRSKNYYF